jgi:hypothetical protein
MKARFLLITALALFPLIATAGEKRECQKSSKSCAKSAAECKKDKKDCAKEKCAQDGTTCEKHKQS